MGRGQGHMTHFLKFCPNHIFGIVEGWHFKFHVLIDTLHRSTGARVMSYPKRDVFT